MAEVQVSGLTKRYAGTAVLEGLDLHVHEGEFVTLLGPSGCGKTTTLRCVAGLEVPDAGEIRIGSSLASSARAKVFTAPAKRDIGMVFQSYALWPHMSVFGNVAYPLTVRGVKRAEVRQRVHGMLELVGLSHLATRSATALSGGQQQRVAVARALVSHPRLLLFDEPLSNLDATLRASMRTELRALHARTGTTSICVTHDQIEALTLSDRVVVMLGGRIQQIGTPETIFSTPANRFVAGFVGYENFLPGTVVEQRQDGVVVELDGIGRVVRGVRGTDGVARGTQVEVGMRSSALQLTSASRDDGALLVTVVDRAYLGEHVQFTVELAQHRLVATVTASAAAGPDLAELGPGGQAAVVVAPGGSGCFPREGLREADPGGSDLTGLSVPEEPGVRAAS